MQYIKIAFQCTDSNIKEILIAMLSEEGFEGFEETDELLNAFIPATSYKAETVQMIADAHSLSYRVEEIKEQNWNAEWEKNFKPVVVEGVCTIRADFHDIQITTPHEIIITPKMSFGTGHHATTQLMMKAMYELPFKDKTVFDFGTGTGILAILAEKLGAASVLAIDNDEWSSTNALENIERNNSRHITVQQGTIEDIPVTAHNYILANINRHILLMYMNNMHALLADEGKILMSGLLKEDKDIIVKAATEAGFQLLSYNELNNWISLLFCK